MNFNTIKTNVANTLRQDHKTSFSKDILFIKNIESKVLSITQKLEEDILKRMKRRGAVIGISGGIDSSVSLALAAKALGTEKVTGIFTSREGFK